MKEMYDDKFKDNIIRDALWHYRKLVKYFIYADDDHDILDGRGSFTSVAKTKNTNYRYIGVLADNALNELQLAKRRGATVLQFIPILREAIITATMVLMIIREADEETTKLSKTSASVVEVLTDYRHCLIKAYSNEEFNSIDSNYYPCW